MKVATLFLIATLAMMTASGQMPEPGSASEGNEPGVLEEEVLYPEMDWTSPDWAIRGPPWYEDSASIDCEAHPDWCQE